MLLILQHYFHLSTVGLHVVFVDFAFYKMFHSVNGVTETVKVIANEVERSAEIAANKLNKNQNKTWKQHAADYFLFLWIVFLSKLY